MTDKRIKIRKSSKLFCFGECQQLIIYLAIAAADRNFFSGDPQFGLAEFFDLGQWNDKRSVYPNKIPYGQFLLDTFKRH